MSNSPQFPPPAFVGPATFVDEHDALSPTWWNGPNGMRVRYSMAVLFDDLADGMISAVKARFPAVAPTDAYPWLAADRLVAIGPTNTNAQIVDHLNRWLVAARYFGTDEGILLGILGYLANQTLPWTPNTATIPAVMWLRADNIALGNVATWTDLTPNGNSPTNAGTKPINTAASGPRASQPAVLWTGSESVTTLAHNLIGVNNFTMVTVAKASNTSAAHCIVNSGSTSTGWLMGVDVNVSTQRDFNANGDVAISDTTSNATTSYEAWIFECDGSGNVTLSVNNVTHTLSPSTSAAISPANTFAVGSTVNGTSFMVGAIWEVIVFPTKLGATDRANLVSYLSTDTGLF